MYRRIGRRSTGGVPGGALWREKWHHWYDSEECAETMASLHLNLLHCRCYKGLGWEAEKEDFPNVVSFARNCRKHGIKVLAYIQHASVYPEIMRREIPNLADWCSVDRDGKLWNYLDSYWRWIPCPNRPGYLEYMDKVIAPTSVPASRIKVPPAMQETGYQLVTLDGASKISFHGDTVELPAFEGMLMLIAGSELPGKP